MSRLVGAGSLGLATSAMAVEGTASKATSPSIPGVGVSRKVGGLANKIRGICLFMVCEPHFDTHCPISRASMSSSLISQLLLMFLVDFPQDELQRDLMQERW